MSGRTVVQAAFLVLTLAFGFAQSNASAALSLSQHRFGPPTERFGRTIEIGLGAPADSYGELSPSHTGQGPTDVATHDTVEPRGSAFDLFYVRGEFDPLVRNLLKTRFLDVPDFGPAVPDPNVLAIFGLGLLVLGFLRRLIT